jgi:hypothetical protein
MEVAVANVGEFRVVRFPAKIMHGIGTEEAESVELAEIVPEFFQADGCRVVSVCPKECDQFAKDSHVVGAFYCL